MPLSMLINRPCTLIFRDADGTKDELGNEQTEDREVASVCEVQQRRRDELDQGDVATDEWNGYFLPGPASQLSTGDAVEVQGIGTFELVGTPWPARNPRTQAESHVEATLKWVAGAEDAS